MTRRRDRRVARDVPGAQPRHIPVLLARVLEVLQPGAGQVLIDATFGNGGYAKALLDAGDTKVIALDRDPAAVVAGYQMAMDYVPRLSLMQAPFGSLKAWADEPDSAWPGPVDGVVFDLGVSSMQIDQPERGFSFHQDGPLDMRMSSAPDLPVAETAPTAADLVNTLDEAVLADILYHYGEERRSRAIARAIVAARTEKPLSRTGELAELVARVIGGRKADGRHPATRTFQALRIAVNDELGQLASGLSGAEALLRPGGRLVVVTFHSLEDRIVKRFLAERSGRLAQSSRHLPAAPEGPRPSFQILNPKPLLPDSDEIAANPRARSAKLRWAERTAAAPFELDTERLGLPPIEAGRM